MWRCVGASNGDQKEVMDGKGDDCNAPVHHSCPSKKIEAFAMEMLDICCLKISSVLPSLQLAIDVITKEEDVDQ